MTENDRILLDEILKQKREEVAPAIDEARYFELFAAEQLLKDYDLSYEELESGLVGNGGDGGIDGFFLFVDDDLVTEDFDYSSSHRNVVLRLMLLQAKRSTSFRETPVERLMTASSDILDLAKPIESLQSVYNPELFSAISLFRTSQQELAAQFPDFLVDYYYASRGIDVHNNVQRKADQVTALVAEHFPNAEPTFNFVGASGLLDLARRQPQTVFSLRLAENPISSVNEGGFVCLVSLVDFAEFIADENGHLRRAIFEANVRDYQGKTEVNDEIQQSLREEQATEDFWWLNNGVTVLATQASQSGRTLTIENPQIVNGLQTSSEVHQYFQRSNTDHEDRQILVRVIVPSEQASRDRIIKATNRQTSVQAASLRASDKIHRDIEEYLRPRGIFYDRRKNFYKNQGKPRDKILSIPHLGQAVMAVVLGRPDTARARPSSLLKKDDDYKSVFNTDYPIGLYHVCAVVARRVEGHLRNSAPEVAANDRNNLRFYVAMTVVHRSLGASDPSPLAIAELDLDVADDDLISDAVQAVQEAYEALGGDDQVAKGPELLNRLNSM